MIEAQGSRSGADRESRWRLLLAVDAAFAPSRVLYPDCGFDVSPSLVFPDVTYVDGRSAVAGFFADIEGVLDLVAECRTAPQDAVFRFVRADCARLALPEARFDLVISLGTRPVADSCAGYLRPGGMFLAHPAGRDAARLAQAPDFALAAVVASRSGEYCLRTVGPSPRRPVRCPSDPSGGAAPCDPEALVSGAAALVYRRIG